MSVYTDFWEAVNYGEQGERQGMIWQKPNGEWICLMGSVANHSITPVKVYYDPWTGEKLPSEVETFQD